VDSKACQPLLQNTEITVTSEIFKELGFQELLIGDQATG